MERRTGELAWRNETMALASDRVRKGLPFGIEYPDHRRIIAGCAHEFATIQGRYHSCLCRDARSPKKELAKFGPRLRLEHLLPE